MAAAKTSSPFLSGALAADEFSRLIAPLGPFEHAPHLAVAVSGGSDSMALVLLANEWARNRQGRITAITVDHGIRREAKEEAAQVARWCQVLGVEHITLRWQPPEHVTQMSAREARYQMLADYCRNHAILHLLTAHHRDDQAETLFLRLARGSGLAGLSGMASVSLHNHVRLLRPLLTVPKARLVATLKSAAQPWAEDASNAQPIYTRNRLRQQLANSPQHNALNARALAITESLGQFRNHLNNKLVSYLTNAVSLLPEGCGWLHRDAFFNCPPGIAGEVLQQLVMTLAGLTHPPRSETLERLHSELKMSKPKRNACGLLFEFKERTNAWLVYREPSATAEALILMPQARALWDKRFTVGFSGMNESLQVRALGADGIAWLKSHESTKNLTDSYVGRKLVLASLPSFWHLEKMIAIPHITYVHPEYRHCSFTAQFTPAKALAAPAFRSIRVTT